MNKTIYALASAPGRAGVSVFRVSGPQSFESLKRLTSQELPPARFARLIKIFHSETAALIDSGLVILFEGPASYTGENVVEYHLHGGMAVVKAFLSALSIQPGHRMAHPGEFTRRAFENGKMDLTEAEAVADLIDAETEEQKNQALSQMEGALSRLYQSWTEQLKTLLAHLEADIEFPDEDLPEGILPQIRPAIERMIQEIQEHLDDNRRGERFRDGIKIVVVGAPNAGKSSLVNALAQRDAAIVSEMSGTTRDVIDVHLDLGGYPVILTDTAGLRPGQIGSEGHDLIESEGIRRALKRAEEADIRLLLFDGTQKEPDQDTLALMNERSVIATNKSDMGCQMNGHEFSGRNPVKISVRSGTGLENLIAALLSEIENLVGVCSGPSLTRARHREALEEAYESLRQFLSAPLPELGAEDLRLSIRAIGRITGRVDVEDLLDVIFNDFCIGK